MSQTAWNNVFTKIKRFMSSVVLMSFLVSTILPPQFVQAQESATQLDSLLPLPGTMLEPSQSYTPAIINGLTIDPDNPLNFDFIIDRGDDLLEGDALKQESQKLIHYFLAALTVPEDQLWVNLSPYEDNRIIADKLVQTEMGRDMLAQDYLLKQLMASLMYPERELGRSFWDRVHKKAYQKFGTTDIPTDTFNKIWIVPQKAQVHVHEQSVFIVDTHLKVLLEEDYLSLEAHAGERAGATDSWSENTKEMIKTILIPEIEREINSGKNFANLRQIYHSMLLATWYKKNLKDSLLGQVYMDQNLVKGIDLVDPTVKQEIYQQYVEAFQKGVFDYIREDIDPQTHVAVPRRYFSGGLESFDQAMIVETQVSERLIQQRSQRRQVTEHVRIDLIKNDRAMTPDPLPSIDKRLAKISGWGLLVGRLSAEETEYREWLQSSLLQAGLNEVYVESLANALVRSKSQVLDLLVERNIISQDDAEALRNLQADFNPFRLLRNLALERQKYESDARLTQSQTQTAIEMLYGRFFIHERFSALREHIPTGLILKAARINIHPDWWTTTGSDAYNELSQLMDDSSAKRWIVDHPDDPIAAFESVAKDLDVLSEKIGRGLAIRWVIGTKNPLDSFEQKIADMGTEYETLKSELGEYLANRWIVNNPKNPAKAYQRLQESLGEDYTKLQEAVGQYMAKRWIVRYRGEAWSKYQDLRQRLGTDYDKLEGELGAYLTKIWITHHSSNPWADWIKDGPQRVQDLTAAGVKEFQAKKALVMFGVQPETTSSWLSVLRVLAGYPTGFTPTRIFREMTRSTSENFSTFLSENTDLKSEQLQFALRSLNDIPQMPEDLLNSIESDLAMITDPKIALNIAAAKLGMSTDSQLFEMILGRVPEDKVLPIIWDFRKAKEVALNNADPQLNVFLDFERLKASESEGLRIVASLIENYPSTTIDFLDSQIRNGVQPSASGLVSSRKRAEGEERIQQLELRQQNATADEMEKINKDIAALRLGFGPKNQIRQVLIGQVEIDRIPGIIEIIVKRRESMPEVFESFDQLVGSSKALKDLLNANVVERINSIIRNEIDKENIGRIEGTKYFNRLEGRVAVLKLTQATESIIVNAVSGQFSEEMVDRILDIVSRGEGVTAIPDELVEAIRGNINILSRLDENVRVYDDINNFRDSEIAKSVVEATETVVPGDVFLPETGGLIKGPDLKSFKIGSSADVIAHFQSQLDRFPKGMFSEFGAVLIGDADRIDRLVFPETVLAVPDSDESLQDYSATTFPEIRLMADANSNELYVKVITQYSGEDGHIAHKSMVLSMHEAIFISDIWDAISGRDRQRLTDLGFAPGMTPQQWAERINGYLSNVSPTPTLAQNESDIIMLRELPIVIGRRGAVGTNGSYHLLPEFMLYAITHNKFIYDTNVPESELTYNFGNVHIHSLVNEMDPLQQAVANIVGADVVRRNPSAPDIMHQRASNDIFGKVSVRYGDRNFINAMYTFGGIITVDANGQATGIRWLDFYKEGLDLARLVQLNDAAVDTMMSDNPDARIIAEQYEYVDSITTEELPSYVGDPNYDRQQDPDIDYAQSSDPLGGIDFAPDNWDIDQSGSTDVFDDFDAGIESFVPGSIDGVVPVILNITPITHFPMLLGYTRAESEDILSQLQNNLSTDLLSQVYSTHESSAPSTPSNRLDYWMTDPRDRVARLVDHV